MRLRLTVQRNGLPAANVLWNVSDTNSGTAYTITRLLEDVNHIIPLEAEHWGLEHYVVEVGGFECLHFSPVTQALKEDDHVSIRPLMTAEVRARTLTGRHQISDDGRHLVDGIPFGRPYLRHPHRPAVRIPPRKRQRFDDVEAEGDVEIAGLLTANGEGAEGQHRSSALMNGLMADMRPRSREAGSRKASRTVQFRQPESEQSDDSEEDDEDFAPEGNSDNAISMDDDESESQFDSDSDSDSDSDAGAGAGASSSGSDPSDSDSESSSDSDSDSESDTSSPPELLSSKNATMAKQNTTTTPDLPKHVPPGDGRRDTRSRNSRRTQSSRLRHLKESGELHEDARLSDLQIYEDTKRGRSDDKPIRFTPFSNFLGKRKRLEDDDSAKVVTEEANELERRKRELLARFGEEVSSNVMLADEPAPLQAPVAEPKVTSPQPVLSEVPPTKKETPSRRLRPDTTAISRILARQARPTVKKSKTKAVVDEPPEPESASDPDFWKSRINLSAFECWEEDFELTAPPFPFKQHWDPASKLMRDKASKKKQKKGRNDRNSLPVENADEEEKIILNYDDPPAAENPDAEINAAIEDQLREDVATAAQSDLPPVPEDISTLSELTSSDIKEGAIILCKFFAVNPITVTPEISGYKTAVVEREGDSGNGAGTIQLMIAERDLPKKEKKFDSKGNRVYDTGNGFFMGDDDDDDDEERNEGLWEGMFGELLEGKLLKAA